MKIFNSCIFIVAVISFFQLVTSKYDDNFYIAPIWLFINSLPILFVVNQKKYSNPNNQLLLKINLYGFLLITIQVLIPFFLYVFKTPARDLLMYSFIFLLPLQAFLILKITNYSLNKTKHTLNDVKLFISQNRLDDAIETLLSLSNNQNQKNEILLNKNRLQRLKSDIRKGILTQEEKNLNQNQIIDALLGISNNLF